jgi:uncharacterized DUF497 family protein
MRSVWDESKRLSNIAKHDIDFILAGSLFDGRPVFTVRSTYVDEERWLTTGLIEGDLITIVWTERGGARRLISARRARDAEKRAYRELHE